jgi:hypothetical protein
VAALIVMKRFREPLVHSAKRLSDVKVAPILKLPNDLFQEITSFLQDLSDPDNHLYATLRNICKSWPKPMNLHLCFDLDFKSRWHELVCERGSVIQCKEISTSTVLRQPTEQKGSEKSEKLFDVCCWNSLVHVQNLHSLTIACCTRDFRAFDSLVELILNLTGVDAPLQLPSNLKELSVDIPFDKDKDLPNLKIICPPRLRELRLTGDGVDMNLLAPVVINAALEHLDFGYVGIPRLEGECNFKRLCLECDFWDTLHEQNLPSMPHLTTLYLSCFTHDKKIDVGKLLNALVQCHHVTQLYLKFQDEWVYNDHTWKIDEWVNLSFVSFDFEPDDDILEEWQLKSSVMQIDVLNEPYWTRDEIEEE